MGIVAAGMGHAGVERGTRQPCALGELEGIHIRPQPDALARSRTLNQSGYAVAAHMLRGFQSHVPQDLGHIGGGLLLLSAGLRMLMEPEAVLLHLFPILINDTAQFRHIKCLLNIFDWGPVSGRTNGRAGPGARPTQFLIRSLSIFSSLRPPGPV